MSTRDIYVPKMMIDKEREQGLRKDFFLSVALIYSIIEGWNIRTKPDSNGMRWRAIHDDYFAGVTKKRNTRTKARTWLVENGFITIRQRVCKDGKLRPLRIKGGTPQQYRIKSKKQWTVFEVPEDRYYRANVITITGDDWASKASRANLKLLSRDEGLEEKEKSNRSTRAVWTIQNNAGVIRRGNRVKRLYSPWCFASEEVRKLFLFSGEPWSAFDLGSAQPTIIGKLAVDLDLLTACVNDELYPAIAGLLGYDPIEDRKKAKKPFYRYCYGPMLKDGLRWPEAYLVQRFMAEKFPKTHAYACQKKTPDYRIFARDMQNLEAEIFINGIFADLISMKIPALTCHDGIYCPMSHRTAVEKICREHLSSFFGDFFVLNSSSSLPLVDSVCFS